MRVLTIIDLLVYALLGALTICELALNIELWVEELIWLSFAVIVTVVLCLALRRVRKYSASFANMSIQGRGFLLAHQVMFIAAATFLMIHFMLDRANDVAVTDRTTEERLEKASVSVGVACVMSWLIVHSLMLKIFVKYGKPLEDD